MHAVPIGTAWLPKGIESWASPESWESPESSVVGAGLRPWVTRRRGLRRALSRHCQHITPGPSLNRGRTACGLYLSGPYPFRAAAIRPCWGASPLGARLRRLAWRAPGAYSPRCLRSAAWPPLGLPAPGFAPTPRVASPRPAQRTQARVGTLRRALGRRMLPSGAPTTPPLAATAPWRIFIRQKKSRLGGRLYKPAG